MSQRAGLLLLMSLATVVGCSSPEPQSGAQAPAAAPQAVIPPGEPQSYDLKGKVVSVDKAAMRVTVDHEAIEGFMGAMTMVYPVKDAKDLENLAPGLAVTAKVVSTGADYWLENIAIVIGP